MGERKSGREKQRLIGTDLNKRRDVTEDETVVRALSGLRTQADGVLARYWGVGTTVGCWHDSEGVVATLG